MEKNKRLCWMQHDTTAASWQEIPSAPVLLLIKVSFKAIIDSVKSVGIIPEALVTINLKKEKNHIKISWNIKIVYNIFEIWALFRSFFFKNSLFSLLTHKDEHLSKKKRKEKYIKIWWKNLPNMWIKCDPFC